MNETLRLLQAHHSSRSYKSDAIPVEIIDAIIESAYRAPTSVNSQQISLVVVRDSASRPRIAEIAGGQRGIAQAPVFIAVIADLYKAGLGVDKAGTQQVFQHSLEAIFSAVSEAGIAMATLMTADRAFGLGIVPMGGIRRDQQAINDLLGLPLNTFPVGGVVLGYIDEVATQKPRLPIESFRHEEISFGNAEGVNRFLRSDFADVLVEDRAHGRTRLVGQYGAILRLNIQENQVSRSTSRFHN